MDEETLRLRENERIIMGEIRSGVLDNWYAVEIRASVLGFDVTSVFVKKLIILHGTKSFYDIISNTLLKSDGLDTYFEDESLITKLLEINGSSTYQNPNMLISDKEKINVIPLLKALDIRNPKYLLRFLLKSTPPTCNADDYYLLFKDIIERTEIRARKNSTYGKYVGTLKTKYMDERRTSLMIS